LAAAIPRAALPALVRSSNSILALSLTTVKCLAVKGKTFGYVLPHKLGVVLAGIDSVGERDSARFQRAGKGVVLPAVKGTLRGAKEQLSVG
jgi:hypothetical protein